MTTEGERTPTEEEYDILGREIRAAYALGTIHTRIRASLMIRNMDNGPEREKLAKACRAAIVTSDWKAVDTLISDQIWERYRRSQEGKRQ